MNILEVEGLCFSYIESSKDTEGSKTLDDVGFTVKAGDYVTIAGPNGCGKSTLARILSGLLDADSGKVYLDGTELCSGKMDCLRPLIGIVFQNPDNQFIGTTVRDDIAFGLENHNVPSEQMPGIIEEFAAKTGVTSFLDKDPGSLSGGQKQRAALAGVLAMKPRLLILDEATSMLAPKGRAQMRALFRKLNKKHFLTVISITHDPEEMLESDDLIVMNKGKIVFHDAPAAVFAHSEELMQMGLGLPFTYNIKESFKRAGLPIRDDIQTEEEMVSWLSGFTK